MWYLVVRCGGDGVRRWGVWSRKSWLEAEAAPGTLEVPVKAGRYG